jgi:hypothetical protein
MASGVLTLTKAFGRFYHARNCLYVQKHFRRKEAQIIMSRGVQLPDLFDCLPQEAQREQLMKRSNFGLQRPNSRGAVLNTLTLMQEAPKDL